MHTNTYIHIQTLKVNNADVSEQTAHHLNHKALLCSILTESVSPNGTGEAECFLSLEYFRSLFWSSASEGVMSIIEQERPAHQRREYLPF